MVDDDEEEDEEDGSLGEPPGAPVAILGFADGCWCGGGSRSYGRLVEGRLRQSNQLTRSPVALGGIVGNAVAGFLEASAVRIGGDLARGLGGFCSSGTGS